MIIKQGVSNLLGMLLFLAVVIVVVAGHPPISAQQRPAEPLPLWFPDRLTLRGPGSQIDVSARELKPAEMKSLSRFRDFDPNRSPGVILEEVHTNGPASRAGLIKGDVIIEFDGHPVRGLKHFYRLVEETPPGWTVKANVVRHGKMREISITPVSK